MWLLPIQVKDNAEPAAQAVSDQAIRPAGKAVAQNAEPAAKQVTDGVLRPAGQAVSDNAVPMTKSVMRDQASTFTLSFIGKSFGCCQLGTQSAVGR
jgi:hypothetical protein